jgi:type I restriction enzyme S subunit
MKKNPKTLMPKLRFPEFKDGPGWEEIPIGRHLIESRIPGTGGHIAKKLTVKLWGKGVTEKAEILRGSENTRYYRRQGGQFIYSKLDFLNQAFGVIPPSLDGFESTVDLPCFDIDELLNPKFLLEYVQRECFYKKNGSLADGGRIAKRIQVESFLSFPIALPPDIDEQRKIAACLTSLDEWIAAEGRKLEALRAHKNGLMQQLFPREGQTRPRLRFPEFRDAGEWKGRTIQDLLEKVSLPIEVEAQQTYREIGVRSHGKGIFHKDQVKGSTIGTKRVFGVVEDALVVNIVFAWEQAVAFTTKAEAGMIASHRFPMFLPKENGCDVRFIMLAFLTPGGKHLLSLASPGGAGRNRTLGQDEFEKIEIVVPEKDEQTRIADVVLSAHALIAAQSRKLDGLRTHKKGLMQQLFPSSEGV